MNNVKKEDDTRPQASQADARKYLSAGAQLAAAREANGWTVEQVANHLKLAVRQVEAIERDDFSALPEMVMTRGFIRSYAKLAGLDASSLLITIQPPVHKMPPALRSEKPLSAPFFESSFSSSHNNRIWMIWGGVLIFLIVVLGIVFESGVLNHLRSAATQAVERAETVATVVASASQATNAPALNAPAPTGAPEVRADGPSLSEAAKIDSKAQAMEKATIVASAIPSQPVKAETAPVAAPTVSPSTSPATDPSATPTSTSAQGGELQLHATADTWVEIRRSDRTVLFSRVVRANTNAAIDMSQPVSIVIGNVAGIEVTLRGDPITVKSSAGSNVGRMNLS